MKFFTFGYKGEALGGTIVVFARSAFLARKLAERTVGKTVTLEREVEYESGSAVAYNWNGDY